MSLALGLLTAALVTLPTADRPDLVVADFEGPDYAGWIATGNAFGSRPARGTLPGQMEVSGFLGQGLVNSFLGGDDARGTLTSPPFTIDRPYLNFLIGGGRSPGELAVELLVEGKVARSSTGPNDKPGGSERLEWESWDVTELVGKPAVVRVVDSRGGGWGHINVDQVVQSDRRQGNAPQTRVIVASKRYLHLPVTNAAPVRRLKLSSTGRAIDEFDIKLTGDGQTPDFWVFTDLDAVRGKPILIEARLPVGSKSLDTLVVDSRVPRAAEMYKEAHRPQFHFTSRRGWLNDPNGLVWQNGEYHLYYQHNPYGWDWGNMHWGHAVSPDLVHWIEVGEAINPRSYGDWAFSGSAVVDAANTSGFASRGRTPLVGAYTSTGRGECIVFSLDGGRSFAEFEGNPVVKHEGRDPRLVWHAPTKRWIMAVYDEAEKKQWIAFHSSPDLKTWTYESRIEGYFECPDLFELPMAGKPGETHWILYGADGAYQLGAFDGHAFKPNTPAKQRVWHGNFYAAQTFSNTPDGRRIQIGWANGMAFPGMPFNQQMTFPVELTLRETDNGLRMHAEPIFELALLRGKAHDLGKLNLPPKARKNLPVTGELQEVRLSAAFKNGGALTLELGGLPVVYDAGKATLSCGGVSAPLPLDRGSLVLHALVDRGSVEVFGNGGRVALSVKRDLTRAGSPPSVSVDSADVSITSLKVDELNPAWTLGTAGDTPTR